jgi:manganese/zinc/iron transport system substrate-binding protein
MARFVPWLLLAASGFAAACSPDAGPPADADGRLRVVATTSMIAELAARLGGGDVIVTGLMGPGVDPHLYKASEGDVSRMAESDLVVYNGLHLEGKMVDIFEQMESRGMATVAIASGIPADRLISSELFVGSHDPHVWFDVALWREAGRVVADRLAELRPGAAEAFEARYREYAAELDSADAYVRDRAGSLPPESRVLVTSHDAFGYFGRAYGFEVRGLQGLSTATEAGTADVQALVDFVVERRVPSIFFETSVSPRGIEAVLAAVRDRGFDVRLGGTLYGDALGSPGSEAGTYAGMMRSNIDTIVNALAPPS